MPSLTFTSSSSILYTKWQCLIDGSEGHVDGGEDSFVSAAYLRNNAEIVSTSLECVLGAKLRNRRERLSAERDG
ncbi:hypothetical protein M514_03957 [Trichuris suis]|uniref:Uncharacterized protein n=1 Tax=Trichuris suis TaxID=68888 RepID=A0A085MRN1_9BILA|nr:hypothetical protein M513_03957 [Trichuris suis]KFD59877.1 hypothetical protein M514_03957 [Trichuris suis]